MEQYHVQPTGERRLLLIPSNEVELFIAFHHCVFSRFLQIQLFR